MNWWVLLDLAFNARSAARGRDKDCCRCEHFLLELLLTNRPVLAEARRLPVGGKDCDRCGMQ
jgi:hypothetical protein